MTILLKNVFVVFQQKICKLKFYDVLIHQHDKIFYLTFYPYVIFYSTNTQ